MSTDDAYQVKYLGLLQRFSQAVGAYNAACPKSAIPLVYPAPDAEQRRRLVAFICDEPSERESKRRKEARKNAKDALNELTESCQKLIWATVNRYADNRCLRRQHCDKEDRKDDLYTVAYLGNPNAEGDFKKSQNGFLSAALTYDSRYSTKFSSYATNLMQKAIGYYLKRMQSVQRIPEYTLHPEEDAHAEHSDDNAWENLVLTRKRGSHDVTREIIRREHEGALYKQAKKIDLKQCLTPHQLKIWNTILRHC